MRTAKTLIRLGDGPGWSEASLGAHASFLVLSWGGSCVISTSSTICVQFMYVINRCSARKMHVTWIEAVLNFWHDTGQFQKLRLTIIFYKCCSPLVLPSISKLTILTWWTFAGKELTSWLSACAVSFYTVLICFVPFLYGVWGKTLNSIISVPDYCLFIFVVTILASSFYCLNESDAWYIE